MFNFIKKIFENKNSQIDKSKSIKPSILTLVRIKAIPSPLGDTTIGKIAINGVFECYTLEDGPQNVKIKGKTRIPAGTYKLDLRHSPRFSGKYKHDMIWVKDVPEFEYILIHPGNTVKDTDGCILLGSNVSGSSLTGSRKAYDIFYNKVAPLIRENGAILIIEDK